VPWLRWVVAGLSSRRPGFDTGSVNVGFVIDKVTLGFSGSSPSTLVFPCQFHSTGAPLLGKTKKLIIFITGLHNKPQGCSASVASAAGPFSLKKMLAERYMLLCYVIRYVLVYLTIIFRCRLICLYR
jgi:hypothetical protein